MIFHGEPPDFTHGELDLRDPGANGLMEKKNAISGE